MWDFSEKTLDNQVSGKYFPHPLPILLMIGEDGGLDLKVHFYGIYPLDSILSLSRGDFRERIPDHVGGGSGRHRVSWWWDWVGRRL